MLAFRTSFAIVCVRHKDVTLKVRNKRVELDVQMNLNLSLNTTSALLFKMFTSIWGQATVLPRRTHLLHDLITQVFLRSLQYGIVVMGVIDAFVHAHNHQPKYC